MADRVLRAVITGSSAGAVAAFEATSADKSAGKVGKSVEGESSKIGGLFEKLGNTVGNYSTTAGNAITKMGTKFDDTGSKGENLTNKMGALGGLVGVAVAAGAVAVVAAGLDMAEKYQGITNQIAANENITQKAAAAVGNAFLGTAGTVTYSGAQIATAFAGVAGQAEAINGHALDAKQSLDLMKSAMDLAEASGQNLNTTTGDVTATLQAFGLGISSSPLVSNVLYNASKATGVTVDALTQSLVKTKSKMGDLAPSLTDSAALLLDMAKHGETGRAAMSALGTAFNNLVTPAGTLTTAQQAVKAAQDAANVSFSNGHGGLVSMQSIIAQVSPLIKGMGNEQAIAELKSLGFGSASSKLVDTIKAGPAAFDADAASVQQAGSAHKAAETATSGLKDSFDKLKNGVGDLVTAIGVKLLPIVTEVLNFLVTHKWILGAMGAAFAALGLTMLAFWVGQKIQAMAFWVAATGGIVILVAAIAVGLLWMNKHWKETWDALKAVPTAVWHFIDNNFIKPIRGAFSDVVTFIKKHWELISEILLAPVAPVLAIFLRFHTQIIGFFSAVVNWVSKNFGGIVTDISHVVTDVINFFKGGNTQIIAWISGIVTWVSNHFGAIATDAGNVVNKIVGFFTNLPGKIRQAVNTIVGDFLNLGHEIFNAIVKGLGNIGGAIASKVGAAAHTALNDINPTHWLGTGGLVTKPTLVGVAEAGPELVLNATQTRQVMAGNAIGANPFSSGSGSRAATSHAIDSHDTYYFTVVSNDPQDIVNKLRLYMQRNGALPFKLAAGH
jgi:TP901 family phage tail tape measure protein